MNQGNAIYIIFVTGILLLSITIPIIMYLGQRKKLGVNEKSLNTKISLNLNELLKTNDVLEHGTFKIFVMKNKLLRSHSKITDIVAQCENVKEKVIGIKLNKLGDLVWVFSEINDVKFKSSDCLEVNQCQKPHSLFLTNTGKLLILSDQKETLRQVYPEYLYSRFFKKHERLQKGMVLEGNDDGKLILNCNGNLEIIGTYNSHVIMSNINASYLTISKNGEFVIYNDNCEVIWKASTYFPELQGIFYAKLMNEKLYFFNKTNTLLGVL